MSTLKALSVTAKRSLIAAHTHVEARESGNVPAYYDELYSSFPKARMARGCACYNEYADLGFTDSDIKMMYKAVAL